MLTSNLWIEADLVNGDLGYVEEIVYEIGSRTRQLPLYVMVTFGPYPSFPFNNEHPKILPVSAMQRDSTMQMWLRLAWVLTIDKSQGLILEKETIDIRPRERT